MTDLHLTWPTEPADSCGTFVSPWPTYKTFPFLPLLTNPVSTYVQTSPIGWYGWSHSSGNLCSVPGDNNYDGGNSVINPDGTYGTWANSTSFGDWTYAGAQGYTTKPINTGAYNYNPPSIPYQMNSEITTCPFLLTT